MSSPLAVCYRETLSALCSNNRFEAAFYLTRKVQEVGVIVTPSCIAMLLHMYEVNEDLSSARFQSVQAQGGEEVADGVGASDDRITLLDFQDDILSTCLACAAFDREMNMMVPSSSSSNSISSSDSSNDSISSSSNSSSSSSNSSSNSSSSSSSSSSSGGGGVIKGRGYRDVQAQQLSGRLHPLSYGTPGVVESDHDHGSTGALITTNIKLLCSRGTSRRSTRTHCCYCNSFR